MATAKIVHAYHGAPTYVTVAASQTLQALTERQNTFLYKLIVQPGTTTPGNVILYDGNGAGKVTVWTFPGGASSVADLKPFEVNINATAFAESDKGWYLTTGANVTVLALVQYR